MRSTGPSTITKQPIVQETIHPSIIEEIQPVIHREVGQTVIEHVEQHSTEHVVAPTTSTRQIFTETVQSKALPAAPRAAPVSTTPIMHSTTAAPLLESHTRATVVEQTSRPERIVEVQPVIHREIDAPEVHVIEKHLYEKVPSTGPNLVTRQTIVEETVRPKIIEEIQPVVHRSVPAPFIEHVEQHVSEHVTQPVVSTKEVIVDKQPHMVQPGFAAGGPAPQQFTSNTSSTRNRRL